MDGINEQSTAAPRRSPARMPTLRSRHQPTFSPQFDEESLSEAKWKATEVKVVDFRSGEAVIRHPDLEEMLHDGWQVESAVPHAADTEEVRLLVVLRR